MQQVDKKILICVPNIGRRPNNTHRLFTLALLYLRRAVLRAGWECELLDAYFDNLSRDETVRRIAEMGQFDVVGFTLNDEAMLHEAEAICDGLPFQPTVIAGGVYASRMAQQILANARHIRHVFVGEAEDALQAFLSAYGKSSEMPSGIVSRVGEAVVRFGAKTVETNSLDRFGDWRYADLPQRLGADEYSLVTSRGCTARCNYCVIGPHWSRYGLWRGHSAQWILDKMLELRALGATHINFVDDQFVGSPESITRAYLLADLLAQHGFAIPFVVMTRADTVIAEPGLFARLRDVGLRSVFIGLESGDNATLQKLRKDTSAEEGEAAVAILDQVGIGVSSGTILFHPWSTIASLKVEVAYFERLMNKYRWFDFYGLNEIDILNGTPLSKLWNHDADKWRMEWKCEDPAAQDVYQAWLKVLKQFIFPLIAKLGPARAREVRRHTCKWMLSSLRALIDAREENAMGTAYARISLSAALLDMRIAKSAADHADPLAELDMSESVGERCFG